MGGALRTGTKVRGGIPVRRLAAVLILAAVAPQTAPAQGEPAAVHPGAPPARGQPQRLPSTVDISIPFTVGPPSCTDRSRAHVVSMRIYNVLAQLVAVPLLRADSGAEPPPPGLAGRPLNNLLLPCGHYLAYWNGRQGMSGRPVPAGVYLYELVVDDQRIAGKLTLGK